MVSLFSFLFSFDVVPSLSCTVDGSDTMYDRDAELAVDVIFNCRCA